jgi:hypothetical protein
VEAGLREHDSNGSRATVHQTQKPEFKLQYFKKKKKKEEGAGSVHTCNSNYLGGRDWEDSSLRPTSAKS